MFTLYSYSVQIDFDPKNISTSIKLGRYVVLFQLDVGTESALKLKLFFNILENGGAFTPCCLKVIEMSIVRAKISN